MPSDFAWPLSSWGLSVARFPQALSSVYRRIECLSSGQSFSFYRELTELEPGKPQGRRIGLCPNAGGHKGCPFASRGNRQDLADWRLHGAPPSMPPLSIAVPATRAAPRLVGLSQSSAGGKWRDAETELSAQLVRFHEAAAKFSSMFAEVRSPNSWTSVHLSHNISTPFGIPDRVPSCAI